ncbi:hypothetical protein [Romboutsia sp. 1001713B170207_170306_H8]|uniref:hypothetical protein n=1 Tax=Romboutsia sp. 1001713B170207_170306_H8 TaxID=2787112 RepID=UPI001899BBCC|nr:hypothetical protein [Romboutsia sp. 1001713B170207_170306_H8]
MLIRQIENKGNSLAHNINDIHNYINYKVLAYCIVGKRLKGNIRVAVNADRLIKKLITMQNKG